ncbi:PREDICTED: NGFI-A-binding protein homolog isoform X2 [Polistes canadensis]|uniref:NGFI-A-binding protein homolog isoform X2 n=1 Tax=Polistes canadensis TaxID=91411 RepID=UPI000718D3B2|nr:PREDICTED: NGFI-A-binding protein homolog isoform X2 [Polistes canadensis]
MEVRGAPATEEAGTGTPSPVPPPSSSSSSSTSAISASASAVVSSASASALASVSGSVSGSVSASSTSIAPTVAPLPVIAASTPSTNCAAMPVAATHGVASPPQQTPPAVIAAAIATATATAVAVPKIFSRNVNGTLVQTSVPQNEAELQLYRVMQRASLLGYYDTLLEMGGDDVQQLCDAGEEEFLEIMALVGMASKPLHVRRLQKALQEWLTNPSLFQTPVVPTTTGTCKNPPAVVGFPCASPRAQVQVPQVPQVPQVAVFSTTASTTVTTTSTMLPCRSISPIVSVTSVAASAGSTTYRQTPSPGSSILPVAASYVPPTSHSPGVLQVGTCESSCGSGTTPSPSGTCAPASPTQLTPTLLHSQIQRLAEAAERLAATIRPVDPKPHNVKKKFCKNLELVMAMPDNDPRRMEEIRKYAAIYGRFDCKRKPEKPLTLHEICVNEAAAQICRFVPALLTRRDELFPLARRVVRDSGYHYVKSQYLSMSSTRQRENGEENELERGKRRKLELEGEAEDAMQEELDLRCSVNEVNNAGIRRHGSSSPVWRKKSNNGVFGSNVEEISDSDSQFSFSNEESSSMHSFRIVFQDTIDAETENTDKENDFNLKVIASRGDNIIAVANPALMECGHPIKEEPADEKPTL